MRSRIFVTPLTIERHTGGEFNDNDEFEDFPPEIIDDGLYSIQPYRQGSEQIIFPDGITSNDVQVVLGKTPIKEADPFNNLKADKTTIDGNSYIAFKVANWSRHGSRADHYKTLFVREDKRSSQRSN